MDINIETILTALSIFSKTDVKFFHNTLGISDKDAEKLLMWAEDIVDGYMKLEGDWDVTDVVSDLLICTKFRRLNSPQALYLIMHGYHCLSSVLEPSDFFVIGENVKNTDFPLSIN